MAGTLTSIRLDTKLADKAVRVLGAKSRTEAVHMALAEITKLKGFKKLMKEKRGQAQVRELRTVEWSSSTARFSSISSAPIATASGSNRSVNWSGIRRLSWLSFSAALQRPQSTRQSLILSEGTRPTTPTQSNWLESGEILGNIGARSRLSRGTSSATCTSTS